MNAARAIRRSRTAAGLTQTELAVAAGTSQATVSAYENGTKQPGLDTLDRLLAATGYELVARRRTQPHRQPRPAELARRGRELRKVLELAAALPTRHEPELRYPRLPA